MRGFRVDIGDWGRRAGLCLGIAAVAGCASTRVTDPPRTATEQFLLSKAAAEAVEQLSFEVLRGRRVFVDTQYFAASEQAFVIGEFRAKLMQSGVQVARSIDDAQIVLEVRSSGVGIDRDDYLLGLPPIQFTPAQPTRSRLSRPSWLL